MNTEPLTTPFRTVTFPQEVTHNVGGMPPVEVAALLGSEEGVQTDGYKYPALGPLTRAALRSLAESRSGDSPVPAPATDAIAWERDRAITTLHEMVGECWVRDGKLLPPTTLHPRTGDTRMLSVRQCRIMGLPDHYAANWEAATSEGPPPCKCGHAKDDHLAFCTGLVESRYACPCTEYAPASGDTQP